ncbi:MAG: glycosyltransferase, partial [Gammaproteobacteria bacterium]
MPAAVLRWKRRLYAEPNVTAVAPTRWLGGCAAESGVFREGGVTVIPNSIETDVFVPGAKEVAKAAIGLDPGIKTLLFGTYNNGEHRKGFDHLAEVLRHMRADARIEALRRSGGIRVLAFGRSTPDLAAADYPFHELGLIDDDIRLATAYSAADVFVLPSREDNQPNVMLEAMACGTPPVAFGVGGIPDTITDGVNGRMIQGFDTAAMAGALTGLLFDPAQAAAMARAARKTIEERYPLDLQAARYEALLWAMGAKTAAATERVRRGLAGGAVSQGRDRSRFVELPLSVPVDLKTGVYGFALNQQGKLDTAEAELRRLRAVVHEH